ncbi:MAG: hypothetical protein PHV61_03860 [Limnochordia bacterium]|jgi:hypothetical protein|nr:hypothetical protein [Limnochordia bacterium]MDD2629288.1 hypothetical protein [Limnochordia bacterium]MDD4518614.1 hypothetical protein [Limnochordia bacterium]
MFKRSMMIGLVVCTMLMGLTLAVAAAELPKNQISVYAYDFEDLKLGVGYARMFAGDLSLALNVDGLGSKPVVNLSGAYSLPEFVQNLKMYVGAGATYDVDAKETTGHALLGVGFSYFYAEYQYGFGTEANAMIRGGLRMQF